MTAPKGQQYATPSGIAGPGGGYFHKHYAGATAPIVTISMEADAVVTLAGFANDRADFDDLIAALGLGKAVTRLREQRNAN